MKVALLTPELFSAEGGLSRILRLYLKALCELPAVVEEVRLVTLIDPTIDSEDLRAYASERLVDWAACRRRKFAFLRTALRAARASDLLICGHIGQLPVAWLCRLRYPKLRYVLIAHGVEVWRSFSWWEHRALHSAAAIWCVSDFTRMEIAAHASLKDGHAVVLPNGLDPFLHPETPTCESETNGAQISNRSAATVLNEATGNASTILTISRLTFSDRYKGIDHLIEAMPAIRAKAPGTRLRVIGRGDDLPRLQKLAAPLGDAVEFLGYVSDDTIKEEISRTRVFALPSEREGFGLVYLEAMAQGKPCIGAHAGGAPEVITPATGLLIPFGDIAALADACVEALTRKWSADAIRARAAEFSYSNFRHRLQTVLAR